MSVLMIRFTARAEVAEEVEASVRKMFAAIEDAKLADIRYSSCRLADGVTYIAQLEVAEGAENPLPGLPAFQEFSENLKNWGDGPPTVEMMTVVASYRAF